MNILFLGGDKRMITAYDTLKEKHNVSSLGLFEGDTGDVKHADILLFPVPTTRDKLFVNAPLTNRKIPLDIVKSAKRGTLILSCGYDFSRYPQIDYGALDSFCIKNAVSTAEGAIAFAIDKTDFTLFGSKILIIGFGRVGKALLSRLSGFYADICVSARSEKDFAVLESIGQKTINTADVCTAADQFDIIFNTVDLPLFPDDFVFSGTYLFDLSTKGCISDYDKAQGKTFKLPGIPGKTAAVSAGKIIAETVEQIINAESLKY